MIPHEKGRLGGGIGGWGENHTSNINIGKVMMSMIRVANISTCQVTRGTG